MLCRNQHGRFERKTELGIKGDAPLELDGPGSKSSLFGCSRISVFGNTLAVCTAGAVKLITYVGEGSFTVRYLGALETLTDACGLADTSTSSHSGTQFR